MSCPPCAAKVTSAVRNLPGVSAVAVDLASGRLTVGGTAAPAAIAAAVTDAGYQITPA
ncbi:heavy-metal-associated domain-containing protein [Longispora sp. K20-0274]|uniref:heavy-metal-associated domain-containing protein n=1 Tax=Longispora sp. K20-0274 TaxID=3088255 RepID=UPI00399AB14D